MLLAILWNQLLGLLDKIINSFNFLKKIARLLQYKNRI